jgi:PRC-barrel domain
VTAAIGLRVGRRQCGVALAPWWCLCALLSACNSSRVAERANSSAESPTVSSPAMESPTVASPAMANPAVAVEAPERPTAPEPSPIASTEPSSNPLPATAASAPPCECAVPKTPATPKHKRPSTPRKVKAPPPPYTVGSDIALPSAAVINAQVGEIGSGVTSILGKKVQGPKGEDLGRVVDVLADANGRVQVAIIDFGGFLGVGSRRIAVDWPLLRFDPAGGDKSLILSVSREKLQSAPEYKDSTHPRVLMLPPVTPSQAATDSTEVKK